MGSEAKGVLEQIDALREELLGYDAAADRSGARWDELKIALDVKLLAVRETVSFVEPKVLAWAAWRSRVTQLSKDAQRVLDEGSDPHFAMEPVQSWPVGE